MNVRKCVRAQGCVGGLKNVHDARSNLVLLTFFASVTAVEGLTRIDEEAGRCFVAVKQV